MPEKISPENNLQFAYQHALYVPVLRKVIVPGYGEMTALDICCDEEVQKQLVESGSEAIKKIEPKPTAAQPAQPPAGSLAKRSKPKPTV